MAYTPYRKVAKNCLSNPNWFNYTSEEIDDMVKTWSIDDLESKPGGWGIGAKKSVNPAIDKVAEILGLTEQEKADFIEAVYGTNGAAELSEKNIETFKMLREKAKNIENGEEFILDVLFAVHDVWVDNNPNNFVKAGREGKKFQHLPSELIGWKETALDLFFVGPIAEALGFEVNEAKLEKAYNNRVQNYMRENNINNKEDLIEHILKAEYEHLIETNTPKTREEAELMATQSLERIASSLKDKETGDGGRV